MTTTTTTAMRELDHRHSDGIDVRMSGKAVLGAKSSELQGQPRPGAPVLIVRCDVFCGQITVRRPDWGMRRRAARAAWDCRPSNLL